MKYLILLLVLTSCSQGNEIYRYDNTVCHEATVWNCGAHLNRCENGAEYYCVTNIKGEKQ